MFFFGKKMEDEVPTPLLGLSLVLSPPCSSGGGHAPVEEIQQISDINMVLLKRMLLLLLLLLLLLSPQ
jgi:hypothetical protein